MSMMQRILVVEDDRLMIEAVQLCLSQYGYRIIQAHNGEDGLHLALSQKPDLVLLDLGLPKLSGLEVCRELRRLNFSSPILMLTARHLVEERVTGLNAGADDYLPKPFDLQDLLARIQALLRRTVHHRRERLVLEIGDVRIDLEKKTATRAGQPLALTRTEFSLLELLGRKAGEIVTRETILDAVWGYARFPTTRTIDTHIWRLRKKIGDDAENPCWLKHLHGRGYSLVCTESPAGTEAGDGPADPAR